MKNDIETAKEFLNSKLNEPFESYEEYLVEYADKFIPKWISVTDELPEEGKVVLVVFRTLYIGSIATDVGLSRLTKGRWSVIDRQRVSHWMPLPEPPKQESKEDRDSQGRTFDQWAEDEFCR